MPSRDDKVIVRYTGAGPASKLYRVAGMTQRYPFGGNSTHRQNRMPIADYELLKKDYPRLFLIIPDDMAKNDINLHDRFSQFDLIDKADRDRIVNAGINTVGEVMAIGSQALARIFPGKQEKVDAILEELYVAYLGYDRSAFASTSVTEATKIVERDDLTTLTRVGSATQAALNAMGIHSFADVANMTLEQWLSMAGKTEESYSAVVEAAKSRIGG